MPVTRWIRSNVTAPILAKGKLLGFISLDSAVPGYFQLEHLERLQAFADQAAIAIENARLFEAAEQELAERKRTEAELTCRLRETELLNQVIIHAAALDLAEALDQICGDLATYYEVPQAGIAVLERGGDQLRVVAERHPPGGFSALGALIPVAGQSGNPRCFEPADATSHRRRDPR